MYKDWIGEEKASRDARNVEMLIRQRGGEKWIKKKQKRKNEEAYRSFSGSAAAGWRESPMRLGVKSPLGHRPRGLLAVDWTSTASHPSRSLQSNPSLICKSRYCFGRHILLGKTHTCSVSTDSEVGKGSGISSRSPGDRLQPKPPSHCTRPSDRTHQLATMASHRSRSPSTPSEGEIIESGSETKRQSVIGVPISPIVEEPLPPSSEIADEDEVAVAIAIPFPLPRPQRLQTPT
ncbi:hypothetical protein BJX96DRAFT_28203 [Aspergillus floccosus]